MPALMITNVQAIASTPFTAVACRMLTMLSTCRKLVDDRLKKIIIATRLANASSFCRALAPSQRPVSAARRVGGGAATSRARVSGMGLLIASGLVGSMAFIASPRRRGTWRAA